MAGMRSLTLFPRWLVLPCIPWLTFLVLVLPDSAFSQVTSPSAATASAAGWCSNALYSSLSTIGQGCPAGSSTQAQLQSHSGFLDTFLLFPEHDNDGDGVPDEDDPDDDNDGIPDVAELAGTWFSPATPTDMMSADSDGDGDGDRQEADAGTNPTNETSVFAITEISTVNGEVHITWQSRRGVHYHLLGAPDVTRLRSDPSILDTITPADGDPPWYETESRSVLPADSNRVYRAQKTDFE